MSFTNLSLTSLKKQIVSDEVQTYLDIYLRIIAVAAVGVFGIMTNALSTAVFVRQGLQDCVSVCLLSLTLTNLASVISGVLTVFCKILTRVTVLTDFDPIAVYYTLPRISGLFYNMSTITTAFISLERCLCVTWPLKFSSVFTFRKTLVVLTSVYLYAIVVSLPDQLTLGLTRGFDPRVNRTRTVLWLSPHRYQVDLFTRMFCQLTIEPLCLLILLVSTHKMVSSLQRSLLYWADQPHVHQENVMVSNTHSQKTAKENSNVIMKRKVVKSVAILAIVAFVCNSQRLVLLIINHAYPDMSMTEPNLYADLLAISFLLQTVNASTDIFVYLAFNVSFRQCFMKMFCRSCARL